MNGDKPHDDRAGFRNNGATPPSPHQDGGSGNDLVDALRQLTERLERVERDLERASGGGQPPEQPADGPVPLGPSRTAPPGRGGAPFPADRSPAEPVPLRRPQAVGPGQGARPQPPSAQGPTVGPERPTPFRNPRPRPAEAPIGDGPHVVLRPPPHVRAAEPPRQPPSLRPEPEHPAPKTEAPTRMPPRFGARPHAASAAERPEPGSRAGAGSGRSMPGLGPALSPGERLGLGRPTAGTPGPDAVPPRHPVANDIPPEDPDFADPEDAGRHHARPVVPDPVGTSPAARKPEARRPPAPGPGPRVPPPMTAGGFAERPQARRRSRRWVLPLLLLIAAGAGGYWYLGDRISGTGGPVDQLRALIGDGRDEAPVPPAEPTAETGVPSAGTEETDAPAAPTAEEPARQPGQQAGPAIEAAPREAVDVAELAELDPRTMAQLPPGAPQELQDLARAALDGNADAQHDLATVFALGEQLPAPDYERAAYWYRRSANAGVVNAQYNLGVLTERGQGVPQDSARAFQLFLRAAEAGHPDAQNAVGLAYMSGRGVEPDPGQAATWFQAASGNGNPRGAYHLGRLFERGLDGAPDPAAAAGWYRVAAEAGDAQAQAALDRITATGTVPIAPPSVGSPPAAPDSTPEPVAPTGPVTADMIREAQELLNRLGYQAGPADGLMGARTRAALEQFQRDRSLPVTGEASGRTLSALREAAAAR